MTIADVLVCDLDNTLYDWVGYFVPSFYAMVDVAVQITKCNKESLLEDFREIHKKYGDSEQPFALLETETIKKIYRNETREFLLRELDPALHAFNSTRLKNLKLYDGVIEALAFLRMRDVKLVAYTESKLYGALDRLGRLGLFEFFERIYCRERSISRFGIERDAEGWLEKFPMSKVIELSDHQKKPDPAVLLEICRRERMSREKTAYVGDSIARDILMAKRAGMLAIWAAYGAEHRPELHNALVRISHWTPDEVLREERLREEAKTVQPDYVAWNSFAEVVAALGWSMRLPSQAPAS